MRIVNGRGNHTGNDNNGQQHNNTDDDTHTHLHVLPPHLLAYTVGSTAETLSRLCKVVGLILERVQALTALGYLVDVVAHNTNGVIDLLRP